jgi:fatty acid desaturase
METTHPHDLQGRVPERLPAAVVRELSILRPARALLAVAEEWASIAAAIVICERFFHPLLYVLAVIVIGARQHALSVIGHDATHFRFLPNRRLNDWVANLTALWPTFLVLEGFRHYHGEHHRFTGEEGDGNRFAWRTHSTDGKPKPEWVYPKSPAGLFFKILRRAAFVTGLFWILRGLLASAFFRSSWLQVLVRLFYYCGIVAALVAAGALEGFLLYWIVPFCTWHMAAQYIRLVCEHSAVYSDDPDYGRTRTTLARWWERWLIVPRNIHYHIEHHWYPSVPLYNLPALHARLMEQPGFRQHAVVTGSVMESLQQCVRWRRV